MKILSDSPSKTKKLGVLLAKEILKTKNDDSVVIGLKGELGAGKTTFIQGFAEGLGIKNKITSPTFVIFRKYKIPRHKLTVNDHEFFYHMDAYRIEKISELNPLEFKKIMTLPGGIIVIEWPEKIKKVLLKNTIWLSLKHGSKENERILEFKNESR
ncbi:MAG: tRNA (adenosine(37)-N6)-threonylcarbamoyltransferase complex ATPase subunit type 1 TsaE [Minisyncoccia bacterium]